MNWLKENKDEIMIVIYFISAIAIGQLLINLDFIVDLINNRTLFVITGITVLVILIFGFNPDSLDNDKNLAMLVISLWILVIIINIFISGLIYSKDKIIEVDNTCKPVNTRVVYCNKLKHIFYINELDYYKHKENNQSFVGYKKESFINGKKINLPITYELK